MLADTDLAALNDAIARLAALGEPTEDEPFFLRTEGPLPGWCAYLVWDHHDGEMELARGNGTTLAEAVTMCMDNWRES